MSRGADSARLDRITKGAGPTAVTSHACALCPRGLSSRSSDLIARICRIYLTISRRGLASQRLFAGINA